MTADDLATTPSEYKKLKHGFLYAKLKKSGYKIDKKIINTAFIIIVVLLAYVGYTSGLGNNYYISCPAKNERPCGNEFYSCDKNSQACPTPELKKLVCDAEPAFCITPLLEPGFSVGKKPGFLYNYFMWIAFGILACAYLMNHQLHNSRVQREIRKAEWEKTWKDSE
jgi:hypothetical protein